MAWYSLQRKNGDPAFQIAGGYIIGAQATELIHEPAAIMKMKGTARDIEALIHGHPCLLEIMQRAAQSLCS